MFLMNESLTQSINLSNMKKNFLLIIALFMAVSANLNAAASDLFSYNEEAVSAQLADLTELENYIWNNPTTTLSVLVENGNNLVSGLNLASPNALGMSFGEPPLGIPSFLWGCAFGVVGVALVYFISEEDTDETKKAFYGCITSTLVYAVVYVVFWGAWFGTAYI